VYSKKFENKSDGNSPKWGAAYSRFCDVQQNFDFEIFFGVNMWGVSVNSYTSLGELDITVF
jgi:hypothetical protein